MRAVLATTVVWVLTRFAFWIGYHRSAAMRGLGAPGMALGMIVLLYVAVRIGYEVGGFIGAAIPVAAFLAIEAFCSGPPEPCRPPIMSMRVTVHVSKLSHRELVPEEAMS